MVFQNLKIQLLLKKSKLEHICMHSVKLPCFLYFFFSAFHSSFGRQINHDRPLFFGSCLNYSRVGRFAKLTTMS